MAEHYSKEFKLESVRRVIEYGEVASQVAYELGVNVNTFYSWVTKFKERPESPFVGSGHLPPEAEHLRKLERENRVLKEEIEILKKAAAYFAKNQR